MVGIHQGMCFEEFVPSYARIATMLQGQYTSLFTQFISMLQRGIICRSIAHDVTLKN